MTNKLPGKLKSNCPEFPTACDVCNRSRAHGNHQKCSKIRQERNKEPQP